MNDRIHNFSRENAHLMCENDRRQEAEGYLPGPRWRYLAPNTYSHYQLQNMFNEPCLYTFEEARTIQNGWDI